MEQVQIHCNMETEEYTVSCPNFDDFCTLDEQEAIDEAHDMREQYAAEFGEQLEIVYL